MKRLNISKEGFLDFFKKKKKETEEKQETIKEKLSKAKTELDSIESNEKIYRFNTANILSSFNKESDLISFLKHYLEIVKKTLPYYNGLGHGYSELAKACTNYANTLNEKQFNKECIKLRDSSKYCEPIEKMGFVNIKNDKYPSYQIYKDKFNLIEITKISSVVDEHAVINCLEFLPQLHDISLNKNHKLNNNLKISNNVYKQIIDICKEIITTVEIIEKYLDFESPEFKIFLNSSDSMNNAFEKGSEKYEDEYIHDGTYGASESIYQGDLQFFGNKCSINALELFHAIKSLVPVTLAKEAIYNRW